MFSTGERTKEDGDQEDFLIRIIRQAMRAVIAIAKLRNESKLDEAQEAVHATYQTLLDMDPWMVQLLSPALLVDMAREKGVLEPLARLLEEDVALRYQLGEVAEAQVLQRRYLEVKGALEVVAGEESA